MIKSDSEYIESRMNELTSLIDSSLLQAESSESYNSTTLIPSSETQIVLSLINAYKTIFNNIQEDAQFIKYIGEDFELLDIDLEKLSSELNG